LYLLRHSLVLVPFFSKIFNCQAQPKLQFNWAELALLSHFHLNLLILLWFLTRKSIVLSHFALKLTQIFIVSISKWVSSQWGINPLAQTKPGYILGTKLSNSISWEE
jgi:hypothetical protein